LAAPVYVAGQILSFADCDKWFTGLYAYKGADTGRTSTTSSADPDLAVTADANATYHVSGRLFWKTTATGVHFKWWAWTIPSGTAAGLYHAHYTGSGGGAVNNGVGEADQWTDASHFAGTPTGGVAGDFQVIAIEGTLATGGSSGTFALNWSADGAATITLMARSFLHLTRMG